ncbi:hypothetical protein KKH39_03820 [Patescibacteria group bacterium]|nr:hypothetical protein [Patescibacteria group bacterium]
MKKIIQSLLILILLIILVALAIFFANPGGLRDKFFGSLINSYLSQNIPDYKPVDKNTNTNYDHPYMNDQQEQTLYNMGIDVSQLPTSITPEMQSCFVQKLGQDRVNEIIAGQAPSPLDLYKTKDCL